MVHQMQKVVVIGLDGATPQLLWPWAREGKLPTLARLIVKGVHGELRSTIPPLSPSAWSSFATGKNPGKHCVFDHVRRRPGSYELEPMNASKRQGKTLWHLLSDHGLNVGVVNVPGTYPPERVSGYMVTGMYTPSKESTYTFPASLAQELEEVTGGYALFSESKRPDDYDQVLAALYEARRSRMKAISYVREKYPTDFFMFVFDETDRVQHKFWKFMDQAHPLYNENEARKYENAILDTYRQLDRVLEQIVENCDDETAIIVMSDHGFGPLYKYLYLNNWLLAEGYLRLHKSMSTCLKHSFYTLGVTPANALNISAKFKLGLADQMISKAKKDRGKRKKGILRHLLLSASDVDWSTTSAYAMGGNLAGIYLNVKGREPQGSVEPGQVYERLRREIMEKLRNMRDPSTAGAIFSDVFRREEVYSGQCLEQAPDIVFVSTNDRYVAQGAQEFMFSSNQIMGVPHWPPDSGTHYRDGILVMYGKPFQPGSYLRGAEIIDLAPTILLLMGVPIPSDMDGKVLESAFGAQYLAKHPIRYATPEAESPPDSVIDYSAEEEEAVARRLEDLGYLG
jgi:predicted AlkP superfamily phosphohydrolase/phosphomutase